MSLTGRPVLLLTAALAVLTPVVAVLLWERVRGSRWQQVVGRIGLLGIGEVAALVFAFVALNDYAGFLDSWSQAAHFVTGVFRHNGQTSSELGRSQAGGSRVGGSVARAAAKGDFKLGTQQAPAPDGSIWRVLGNTPPDQWPKTGVTQITDLGSGQPAEQAYIYLPPQYFGPNGRRDLPILEMFTSFTGPTDYLVSKMHAPEALLSGIQAHQVAPMVVVMMRPDADGSWNTACTDVPNGPQALTYYTKGLPGEVRSQLGLKPAPLLAMGYAEGAYCAAKVAMFDPTDFPGAVEMSGSYHPPTDASTQGVFSDETVRQENDLGWRLENLPTPSTALLLTTAADDNRPSYGRGVADEWSSLVRPPMTAAELVLAHRGAGLAEYTEQLGYDLSWLSARLPSANVTLAPIPAGATSTPVAPTGPQALATMPPTASAAPQAAGSRSVRRAPA